MRNITNAYNGLSLGNTFRPACRSKHLILCISVLCLFSCTREQTAVTYDVIVLGEGTGATAAAIQSARSGAKTFWANPLPWAGGMLTAAGVSATDGNHNLPSGIWGEFRQMLHDHYGGPDSVFTGWVSNTMFEPRVGHDCFEKMIQAENRLEASFNTHWESIKKNGGWEVLVVKNGAKQLIKGKVLIDGTDLGDVAAQVGAGYDTGMDSKNSSGESIAPEKANDIVQDLTYAAILKDFGDESELIPKPEGYDAAVFYCACQIEKCEQEEPHPCDKMLTYGQLPNDKYMINWPKHGNDYYANVVEMNSAERQAVYEKAKLKTLQFIYFIQTELGYKNLGLAEDEFPTPDKLPLYPYHREGRRVHGKTQLNINHILKPYDYYLYRTGIAVGDYPIDHHHAENPAAPEFEFPAVPSFSIPLGCLIPKDVEGLVVADKAISVTNIVNGSSRLQPVILQVGQVAGIVAALATKKEVQLSELDIRAIQTEVLDAKGYLLPFIDVPNDDVHFSAVQKIGATGILQGHGRPFQWANQTWFHPDTFVVVDELIENLQSFDSGLSFSTAGEKLGIREAVKLIFTWHQEIPQKASGLSEADFFALIKNNWETDYKLKDFNPDRLITKKEFAVLLDEVINPFDLKEVDFTGGT